MKPAIIAVIFVTVIGTVYAQRGNPAWFDNTKYQLKDGHSITLRQDGKIDYDGRFLFERIASKTETDHYIPYLFMIVNESGEKHQVLAALELHELKSNRKIWFTIYQGPLGPMRQSWFAAPSDAQAKM